MIHIKLTKEESSLVKEINWDEDTLEMEVVFHKYIVESYTYYNVPKGLLVDFISAQSIGKYYLNNIKNNLNLKDMANKPAGINKSSDQKRFIKMRIDVKKLNKDFFFVGEKGVYAELTLIMLPDGEVDKFENLGMIVQDVPYELAKKDKTLKGEILGNGKENHWMKPGEEETTLGYTPPPYADDLPF